VIDVGGNQAYICQSHFPVPGNGLKAALFDRNGISHNPFKAVRDTWFCQQGRTFDQSESDLKRDWARNKGSSSLTWDRARHASRDSWQRTSDAIERAVPGDSDRDGM
jgi:hypothetical protein